MAKRKMSVIRRIDFRRSWVLLVLKFHIEFMFF
jgi:hypothetical protein